MLTEVAKTCANPHCPLGTQPVSNFYLDKRRNQYRHICKVCQNKRRVELDRRCAVEQEQVIVLTGKMKVCAACKVAKDKAYFSPSSKNKLHSRCKACRNATRRGIVVKPVKSAEDIVRESGLKVLRETRACDAMARYFGW